MSLLPTAFAAKWLLSVLCSEPIGSHSLFPASSLWADTQAAGMEQESGFLYVCACCAVSKIMVVIVNTLVFRSRLPPSSLGPVPCALAGAQVAGPWGQRGTTLVRSVCPAGPPSTSSLKLCPGSWQGSCQCRQPDFRESSGSSGQRGWNVCQMKGPPPP